MPLPDSTSPMLPELRVLVVDDDEGIRSLLRILFRRNAVAADFAHDGFAALESMRARHYDVIILDLMLPGTNGFEVIQALRSTDSESLARTIVLTAVSDRTLQKLDDGLVRRVMRKPFDIDELLSEVRACSCARSAPAPAADQHVH